MQNKKILLLYGESSIFDTSIFNQIKNKLVKNNNAKISIIKKHL